MFKKEKGEYNVGDRVENDTYGVGTITSIEEVEEPSDGESTMLVVLMDDGTSRNLKESEVTNSD